MKEDNVSIWDLPKQTSLGWSPYLVVTSTDKTKKVTSLSVFAIGKAIRACGIDKPKQVSPQGSGDLLIEVRSFADSVQLRKCTLFGSIPVSVEPHRSLNTSRGVVKSRDLAGCTEEEMVQEIEGVTHARRIIVRRDGKEIRTNTWILTFDCPKPPTKLSIEYLELDVRPYIPNPMRCFNCQRFGHTKQNCRRNAVCPRCGKEGHSEESCSSAPRCPNCQQGGHTAYSKDCPKYSDEKAILTHRAKFGGTFAQARAAVFPVGYTRSTQKSYSDAAKAGPRPADANKKQTRNPKPTPPTPSSSPSSSAPSPSTPTPVVPTSSPSSSAPPLHPVSVAPTFKVPLSNRFSPLEEDGTNSPSSSAPPSSPQEEEMESSPSSPSLHPSPTPAPPPTPLMDIPLSSQPSTSPPTTSSASEPPLHRGEDSDEYLSSSHSPSKMPPDRGRQSREPSASPARGRPKSYSKPAPRSKKKPPPPP